MYCRNCGKEIPDDSQVCSNCGTGVSVNPPKKETNTIAVVGFILSFFITIAGLICSIVGYRNALRSDTDGRSLALAGIIISAVKLAGTLLIITIYIVLLIAAISIPGGW